MKFLSPLRYPGGKASMTDFLTDVIKINKLCGCVYYEPFAGGAGAALNLLQRGVVSKICLNDADKRIYAFWKSAIYESERFVECINSVPLTIDEWHQQNAIYCNPDSNPQFNIGFATFYMNRCNRSGVLFGSGPIGGYGQLGKWHLGVRFNRSSLSKRILCLERLRDRIELSSEDAIIFLKSNLPLGLSRKSVFVYLDPPYVCNGRRLYFNAYEVDDHIRLAKYLYRQNVFPWIMSYDDCEIIRKLYIRYKRICLPLQYVLQNKRSAHELVVVPNQVQTPSFLRIHGSKSPLKLSNG